MEHWMTTLAQHYQEMTRRYPDERFLILFDIDGTIIDLRHAVREVLRGYDLDHATDYFANLTIDEIDNPKEDFSSFGPLFSALGIPSGEWPAIIDWYAAYRWSLPAIRAGHRPYLGVLEIIRWFQLQPNTRVGLNTGRVERMRERTLDSLNRLGQACRVSFDNALLQMVPNDSTEPVARHKTAAIGRFQAAGWRVFAMIDNDL